MVVRVENNSRLEFLRRMYNKHGSEREFDDFLESCDSEDVVFLCLYNKYIKDVRTRPYFSERVRRKEDCE
jgi:hypothetical protein